MLSMRAVSIRTALQRTAFGLKGGHTLYIRRARVLAWNAFCAESIFAGDVSTNMPGLELLPRKVAPWYEWFQAYHSAT